jgi:hypothetical protein
MEGPRPSCRRRPLHRAQRLGSSRRWNLPFRHSASRARQVPGFRPYSSPTTPGITQRASAKLCRFQGRRIATFAQPAVPSPAVAAFARFRQHANERRELGVFNPRAARDHRHICKGAQQYAHADVGRRQKLRRANGPPRSAPPRLKRRADSGGLAGGPERARVLECAVSGAVLRRDCAIKTTLTFLMGWRAGHAERGRRRLGGRREF